MELKEPQLAPALDSAWRSLIYGQSEAESLTECRPVGDWVLLAAHKADQGSGAVPSATPGLGNVGGSRGPESEPRCPELAGLP